ncbi:MAG: glutathione S-transferase [Porticoccaceae bacterium]|nr:glutathione S-transferase [Porticoccaceae bacterium]
MQLKLWHCPAARSIRPLWTMEEMGLDYEIEVMKFPPRFLHPGYTDINPIGTVPFFTDGDIEMTESAGIAQYLVDRYGPSDLGVTKDEPEYGLYLNWIHRSDATLTFPQTIVLRYTQLEPEERRLPQAVKDYVQWFYSRLRSVERAVEDREYLCAGRFTLADICVGFALYLAEHLGLREGFKENTNLYYERLKSRPAFKRAVSI